MSKKKYDPHNPKYNSIFNFAPATSILSEESQYDRGLLPGMDINEYRANQQTWTDKLGNGLVNMGTSAFTGAVESTIGLAVGLTSAFASGDPTQMYNNPFAQSLDALNDLAKEVAPFYQTEAEKAMGIGESMGTANFWFDKVLGGAGYTVGSLIAGYGMGNAFKALRMGTEAKFLAGADEALGSAQGLDKAAQAANYKNMAQEFGMGLIMAHGESAMEARQTYKEMKDQLSQFKQLAQTNPEYAQYANLTDEQIDRYAKDAASTNYLMNMAITGPTDMLLLGKWINPGKKEAVKLYNEIGTKVAEDGTKTYFDTTLRNKSRAFTNFLTKLGEGALTEGGQEGAQYASNIAAKEFVDKYQIKNKEWLQSIAEGLTEGLSHTFADREGLENMLVGALTGGPFGLKGGRAERIAREKNTQDKIKAMTGFNLDDASSKVQAYLSSVKAAQESEDYLKKGDIFNAKNKSEESLNQMIKQHLDNGTEDFFIAKLEGIKQAGDLTKYFGEGTTTQDIDKVISKVESLKKLNESINTLYGVSTSDPEMRKVNQLLKDQLFHTASVIQDVDARIKSIKETLRKNYPDTNDILNKRDLHFDISKAKLTDEAKKLGKDAIAYYKEYRERTYKDYEESLNKYVKDNPLERKQIEELIGDLNELDGRRIDYVEAYNALNDPKLAKEYMKSLQDFMNNITPDEEVKDEIIPVNDILSFDNQREHKVVVGEEEVDLANMSKEELEKFGEGLFNDKMDGKQVPIELFDAFEKETEIRNTNQESIDKYTNAINKANNQEELDKAVKDAMDAGFKVNQSKINEVAEQIKQRQAQKQSAPQPDLTFKGVNEFFEMFSLPGLLKENYDKYSNTSDFAKNISITVRKNPDKDKRSDIGSGTTLNPRLQKVSPPFIIEFKYKNEPVGNLPWYGQYIERGKEFPIDINKLTEQEYQRLFLPESKHTLQAFKEAYNNSKALYAHINSLLANKETIDISYEELTKFASIGFTPGNYNPIVNYNYQPISNFQKPDSPYKPVMKDGVPIIVSTNTFDHAGKINTHNNDNWEPASIMGESGLLVHQKSAVTEEGELNIDPKLQPAFRALANRIVKPIVGTFIHNNHWILIEDPNGSIELEDYPGKKFDWNPIVPAPLEQFQRDELYERLASAYKVAQENPANRADKKTLNRGMFIALKEKAIGNANGKKFSSMDLSFVLLYPRKQVDGKWINDTSKPPKLNVVLNVTENIGDKQSPEYIDIDMDSVSSLEDIVNQVNKKLAGNINGKFLQPVTINDFKKDVNNYDTEGKVIRGLTAITPQNVFHMFESTVDTSQRRINQGLTVKYKDGVSKAQPTAQAPLVSEEAQPTEEVTTLPILNQTLDARVQAVESTAQSNTNSSEKIADIERRRQEELKEQTRLGYYYESDFKHDWQKKNRDEYLKDPIQFLENSISIAKENLKRDPLNRISQNVINDSQSELDKIREINAKYDAELAALEGAKPIASVSGIEAKKADIEKRRQEEIDNLFAKTQASTDKQLNTPIEKISKEEIAKRIAQAKLENKDLIEELENPEFLNSKEREEEWDKKADELTDKLPKGVSFRIKDGKVELFDNQSYRGINFGGNKIVQVSVFTLHRQNEKFEVGDRLQIDDGVRAIPAEVTKVNENGKVLEAKTEEGKLIISKGNIVTLAPINERHKINAKYDAELDALEGKTKSRFNKESGSRKRPEGPAFSTGKVSKEQQLQLAQAVSNLKRILPSWIAIEELDTLMANFADGKVIYGQFENNIIRLSKFAVRGTEYHEAFHAVFRAMLNQAQRDALYTEIKERVRKELQKEGLSFIQGLKRFASEHSEYDNLNREEMEKIYLEEYMADKFQDFMSKPEDKPKTLLGKLFKAIVDFIRFIKGEPMSLETLFAGIKEGAYKYASPLTGQQTFSSPAYKAVSIAIRTDNEGNDYEVTLNASLQETIENTLASMVFSMREDSIKNRTDYLITNLIDEAFTELGKKFNDDDQFNEFFEAYDKDPERFALQFENLDQLTMLFHGTGEIADEARVELKNNIIEKLKQYGIDKYQNSEEADGENNVTERNFDMNSENVGGFASLSKALRKYIGLTQYETTLSKFFDIPEGTIKSFDNISITLNVNAKRVYDGIVKAVANQSNPDDILRMMWHYSQQDNESSRFLKKFFNDSNFVYENGQIKFDEDKLALVQRVVSGFNLYAVDYKFLHYDPNNNIMNIFDANKNDVDALQVNDWHTNHYIRQKNYISNDAFLKRVAEAKSRLTQIGSIVALTPSELDKLVTITKKVFEGVGIKLSRKYLEYYILAGERKDITPEQKDFVLAFQNSLRLSKTDFINNLSAIFNVMEEGNNPFERVKLDKENKEDLGSVTRLLQIAKDNAVFDETVYVTSIQNAAGKTIYPYQKANFHHQYADVLRKGNPADNKEAPSRDYLENNYLWENEEFQAIRDQLRVSNIDGTRADDLVVDERTGDVKKNKNTKVSEGVTYGDMTPRELAVFVYANFANGKKVNIINTKDGKKIKVRDFLINIMEASNTANTISLPLHNVVDKNGKFTNEFYNFILGEVQREYDRIQKVKNNHYKDRYVNFNWGNTNLRGLQFWENKLMFNSSQFGRDLKSKLEKGEVTVKEVNADLKKLINEYYTQQFEEHLNYLTELGIIKIGDNGIENHLLPKEFTGEVSDDTYSQTFESNSIKANLKYAYFNILVNNTAINQLLMGDPALTLKDSVDWFKRARGNNATGSNLLMVNDSRNKGKVLVFGEMVNGKYEEIKSANHIKPKEYIIEVNTPEFDKFVKQTALETNRNEDEVRQELLSSGRTKIPIMDAQGYTSHDGYVNFLRRLGRMTAEGERIYNMLSKGYKLKADDWKYLKDNNLMQNSLKLVYFDGETYVKLSVAPIPKRMVEDKYGAPLKGKEDLYKLRKAIETRGVDIAGPPSMMKKLIKNPYVVDKNNIDFEGVTEDNLQTIDYAYLRLQQENPSNKTEILDPTQTMDIITAEQNRTVSIVRSDGTETNVGEVLDDYDNMLVERLKMSYIPARAFLAPFQSGKRSLDLKRVLKAFTANLQQTGASPLLMDMLKTNEEGYPIHNFNEPALIVQFERLYNAHFNSVFKQKVPGYKVTLMSGWSYNIVEDSETGKIISEEELRNSPELYRSDRYVSRRLKYNVPRYVDGKETHRYSEIVLPAHFKELFNLTEGDTIPEEIAYLFGTRIPSQDKHSSMVLKIVGFLPSEMGSTAMFPDELVELTGSDFDIDSFYIHRPEHYVDDEGNFKVYGNSEDSKWKQFVTWHSSNNKLLKKLINSDPELNQLIDRLKLNKYNILVAKANNEVSDQLANDEEDGELYETLAFDTLQQLNEYKELDQISKDQIKNLKEQLISKYMKELELPSTESEFNDRPMLTLGEINNKLLEDKILLHTNSHINDKINKTPATLKAVEDVLEKLAGVLGYGHWSELEKNYEANSLMGQLTAFVTNKAGKTAIGAAVNNTKAYIILSRFGLTRGSKGKPVKLKIGDKTVTAGNVSTDNLNTLDNIRIMDILSTFTSAMTDNTKYGYNSKMNVDLNTLSVLSYLTMSGVPVETATWLINQEAIKEYTFESRQYALQSKAEAEYSGDAGTRISEKYYSRIENLIKKLSKLGKDEAEYKRLLEEDLSMDELSFALGYKNNKYNKVNREKPINLFISQIANIETINDSTQVDNAEELLKYLIVQYKTMKTYEALSNESSQISNLVKVLKLTKGVSSSTSDTSFRGDEEIESALKHLGFKLEKQGDEYVVVEDMSIHPDDKPVFNFKHIFDNYKIGKENLNIFGHKQELAKKEFISRSEFAKNLKENVANNLAKRMSTTRRTKVMAAFRRNLESFLIAKIHRKKIQNRLGDVNFNAYIYNDLSEKYGIENVVNMKERLFNNPKFAGLANTSWFKMVQYKIGDDGTVQVNYNSRSKGNAGFESVLANEFANLFYGYNPDPEVRDELQKFAEAHIIYLLAKDGMQYTNKSFVSILPELMSRGISRSLYEITDTNVLNTNTDSEYLYKEIFGVDKNTLEKEFLEMFFRDINTKPFIETKEGVLAGMFYSKSAEEKAKEEGTTYTIKNENGPFKVKARATDKSIINFTVDLLQGTANLSKEEFGKQISVNLEKLAKTKFNVRTFVKPGKTKEYHEVLFPTVIRASRSGASTKIYMLKEFTDRNGKVSQPSSQNWGTKAEYIEVEAIGSRFGQLPYFRSMEENEETTVTKRQEYINSLKEKKVEEQPDIEDDLGVDASVGVVDQLPDMSENKSINIYAGTNENADLSNFAVRPFTDEFGDTYKTVEGYFQSGKLQHTTDNKYWRDGEYTNEGKILLEKFKNASGSEAKSLGRTITNLDTVTWDKVSSPIMLEGLLYSFKQNPNALQKLLATGNAELTHTQDKGKWGKEFPKLLMEVRDELRNTQITEPTITDTPKGIKMANLTAVTPDEKASTAKQVLINEIINKPNLIKTIAKLIMSKAMKGQKYFGFSMDKDLEDSITVTNKLETLTQEEVEIIHKDICK